MQWRSSMFHYDCGIRIFTGNKIEEIKIGDFCETFLQEDGAVNIDLNYRINAFNQETSLLNRVYITGVERKTIKNDMIYEVKTGKGINHLKATKDILLNTRNNSPRATDSEEYISISLLDINKHLVLERDKKYPEHVKMSFYSKKTLEFPRPFYNITLEHGANKFFVSGLLISQKD